MIRKYKNKILPTPCSAARRLARRAEGSVKGRISQRTDQSKDGSVKGRKDQPKPKRRATIPTPGEPSSGRAPAHESVGRESYDSEEGFRTALNDTNLSAFARRLILIRYLRIARTYRNQYAAARTLSYSLRFMVLVGGIASPTLISSLIAPSIDYQNDSETCPSPHALVISLILSVVVSLSNGYMEVFGVVRKHQAYLSTITALRQEAFMFLSLTGRYRRHKEHETCWRKFLHNVEVINSTTIARDIQVEMRGMNNSSTKETPDATTTTHHIVSTAPPAAHSHAHFTGRRSNSANAALPATTTAVPQSGGGSFKLGGVLGVPEWASSGSAGSQQSQISISESLQNGGRDTNANSVPLTILVEEHSEDDAESDDSHSDALSESEDDDHLSQNTIIDEGNAV